MRLVDALPAVVPTPPEYRVWIDGTRALEILRCSPGDLEELVHAGLACEEGRYDKYDVRNVGLFSGSGRTRPELEMIFFGKVLRSSQADWVSTQRYTITASAQCPRGSDCPSSEWTAPGLALPDAHWTEEDVRTGKAEWRGEVELSGQHATVQDPRILNAWTDLFAQYTFQFTPGRLALDVTRTRERRSGDCDALCRVLMQDLLGLGISTELQPGYIFSSARLRRHTWLEIIDIDGQSKVLDPSMAFLADRFFTPDYKEFCCGSSLNRVIRRAKHEDVQSHHSCVEETSVSYLFTLRPAPPPAAATATATATNAAATMR